MSQRNARVEKMTRRKIMDVDVATLEKILGRRVVKAARRQRRREAANLERKALYDDLEKVTSAGGRKEAICIQKPRLFARDTSELLKQEDF